MEQVRDSYLTIGADAEAAIRERSSKFLAYAFHVESEEEIAAHLERLRKRYYDATHHWAPKANGFAPTTTASRRARRASRSWARCSRTT